MLLTVTPNPCVDKTIYIPLLTPGEKARASRVSCVAGGKGCNAARACKAMGRAAKAMTILGGHTGSHVLEMLEGEDKVEVIPVWVASPTRTITTVLEETIHRQTPLFEPGSQLTPDEYAKLKEVFAQTLASEDIRAVSLNGAVPDLSIAGFYREAILIAKEKGVLTLLDSYGPEFLKGLEAVPHMVKPNIHEAELAVGFALDSMAARMRAIKWFHERGVSLVVLSLGAEGALVSSEGHAIYAIPPAIHEVNAVGSGDSLLAGFAIGLMEAMQLEEMARMACAMGTANAMSWDIGHFNPGEVDRLTREITLKVL